MPDRARDGERLRAGRPVRAGAITVLPIERVVLCSERGARGGWVTATLEPVAIVVVDGGRVQVVELDGTAGSLERLRERIPELDALVPL